MRAIAAVIGAMLVVIGARKAGGVGAMLFVISAAMVMQGCADPAAPRQESPPWVQVEDGLSGEPVAGVKLVMMDTAGNRLALGPALSDERGRWFLPDLPPGSYRLLVFGGAAHRPLLPAGSMSVPAAGGARVTALVVPLVPPGGLPRISGTVVDAETDAPLSGAFVSTSAFLTGYEGDTGPQDDVTGSDGRFRVSDIPFAADPITGNLVQIRPLLITREGFRPATFAYRAPNGAGELDITGVRIALERVADPDGETTGSLCGRLLRGGEPAVGVAVGLGFGGDKGSVGIPGLAAVSDPEGRFCLAGLPPGRYVLHPGYLVGDGAVFADQPGNRPRPVGAGETVDAGDLILLQEIDPLEPVPGGLVEGPPLQLRWSAAPGAAEYKVVLDGENLAATQTPAYDLPDTLTLAAGWHWWGVTARDAVGAAVGLMQVPAWFELRDPDAR